MQKWITDTGDTPQKKLIQQKGASKTGRNSKNFHIINDSILHSKDS